MGWGNVPVYGNSSSVYQTKTPITIAPGQNWEQLACGSGFICGLKTNKQLTCWGSGDYALDYTTPKTWPGKYKYVSAKERHVCAVKEDGSVWCAGSNGKGELGSGEVQVGASSKDPVPVTMRDSSDETFVMVSTGNSHTCALSVDSEIFCWGNNNDGKYSAMAKLYIIEYVAYIFVCFCSSQVKLAKASLYLEQSNSQIPACP